MRERVLVAADHELVRLGLRCLLGRLAAGPEEADVALVDAHAPRVARALARRLPVALLCSRWDIVPARAAGQLGALGVLSREAPAAELRAAVRELVQGRQVDVPCPAPAPVRFLASEREILRLTAAGLTDAEIGARVHLSPGTVKQRTRELCARLGVAKRAAAVQAARRMGFLPEPPPVPAPASRARVLVAEPADVLRAALEVALAPRWVAAGAAAARRIAPLADVVLVGGDLPLDGVRLHGGESVAAVRAAVHGVAPVLAVSPRERDVLHALATGATNVEIAGRLGLSPYTVKQHTSSIYRKLGVRNRAEASARVADIPQKAGLGGVAAGRA